VIRIVTLLNCALISLLGAGCALRPPKIVPIEGPHAIVAADCFEVRMPPPELSKRVAYELPGVVTLAVQSEGCGYVGEVRVLKSAGDARLDNAALKRARMWKMPPSPIADLAPSWWAVQVTFFERAEHSEPGQVSHNEGFATVSRPDPISEPP
jgi:TonB family protein